MGNNNNHNNDHYGMTDKQYSELLEQANEEYLSIMAGIDSDETLKNLLDLADFEL